MMRIIIQVYYLTNIFHLQKSLKICLTKITFEKEVAKRKSGKFCVM